VKKKQTGESPLFLLILLEGENLEKRGEKKKKKN